MSKRRGLPDITLFNNICASTHRQTDTVIDSWPIMSVNGRLFQTITFSELISLPLNIWWKQTSSVWSSVHTLVSLPNPLSGQATCLCIQRTYFRKASQSTLMAGTLSTHTLYTLTVISEWNSILGNSRRKTQVSQKINQHFFWEKRTSKSTCK